MNIGVIYFLAGIVPATITICYLSDESDYEDSESKMVIGLLWSMLVIVWVLPVFMMIMAGIGHVMAWIHDKGDDICR